MSFLYISTFFCVDIFQDDSGTLVNVENASVSYNQETTAYTLTWKNNAGKAQAREDDTAMILVYNVNQQDALYLLQGTLRRDESVSILRPDYWKNGDQCNVYIAFIAANGESVSNSRWIDALYV